MSIDKRAIVAGMRAQLDAEIETMSRLARDAAEAATHEENKPENVKDMRSTEASYVARGQAGRVREMEQAHARLGALELRAFGAGDTIEISALVTLRAAGKTGKGAVTTCFVAPVAGGLRVSVGGVEVQTVTPTSPLGAALLGLGEGEEAEAPTPQGVRVYEIVRVE
jgi:transcription elongation GreA/GreB family factor